jgi:hypothetical protein
MSIEEIIKMAHNYGCLYESTLSEVYSEETLLKDLKKQLTLTDVVKPFYCDKKQGHNDKNCKVQCHYCKSEEKQNLQ